LQVRPGVHSIGHFGNSQLYPQTLTRLDTNARDKHSSLFVSYKEKKVFLTSAPGRGYKIRKQHQMTEGWVPTYVLNLLTGGPRRPAWTFKKFRKPSFSSRKDSSGKLVRFSSFMHTSDRGVSRKTHSLVVSRNNWQFILVKFDCFQI
jgi:hypothetical protein